MIVSGVQGNTVENSIYTFGDQMVVSKESQLARCYYCILLIFDKQILKLLHTFRIGTLIITIIIQYYFLAGGCTIVSRWTTKNNGFIFIYIICTFFSLRMYVGMYVSHPRICDTIRKCESYKFPVEYNVFFGKSHIFKHLILTIENLMKILNFI